MRQIVVLLLLVHVERIESTFGWLKSNKCEQISKPKFWIFGSECSCRPGYQVSPYDKTKCVPIPAVICKPGYQRGGKDNKLCVDIDECSNKLNPPCQQKCSNNDGSYTCSCYDGYQISPDNASRCVPIEVSCDEGYQPDESNPGQCVDIDECENTANPPCEQICTNAEGSFDCSCRLGYTVSEQNVTRYEAIEVNCDEGYQPDESNPGQCVDIDECENTASPPCEQVCTNAEGSFECSCRLGYTVSEQNVTRCEAVPIDCDKGLEPSPSDPRLCVDVDECANTNDPPCEQLCCNTEGSFKCSCRDGYIVSKSDVTKCIAINNCPSGFKPSQSDPTKCEDIDECASSEIRRCQQLCINTPGGYECSCRDGFDIDETDPSKCLAVDPCQSNPCQHVCTRTITGYNCSCRSGYQLWGSNKCEDIDECDTNPCEHVCTNTVGSYTCSCKSGYSVSATDSHKCKDYCANSPCAHTCTASGSGFQCSCRRGYTISKSDWTKCDDINECAGNPCEQICVNIKGSFKCSCRKGFTVSSTNKTKCSAVIVDECNEGRRPCEHICTIIPGGRKCSCRPGYVVSSEDDTVCREFEVCKSKADVILALDASSSILAENFEKSLVFVQRLITHFSIGPNDFRFGAVVFSHYSQLLFNLKDCNDHESLTRALSNVPYLEATTYTDLALKQIDSDKMFSSANGGRDDAPDFVFVLTDGAPTNETAALAAARNLKKKGVYILAVAIGPYVKMSTLQKMASTPADALAASSYDLLDYVEERVSKVLCQVHETG